MFRELSVLHSNTTQPSDLEVSTYLVPMCKYSTAVNCFGSHGPGQKVYSEPFIWDTSLKSDGEDLGEGGTGTRQNVCHDR